MSSEAGPQSVRFEPLRPVSRGRLIAAFVLGPILWLVVFVIGAIVFEHRSAIALGLLVAVLSFLVSLVVLALVRAARRREEERYAGRR